MLKAAGRKREMTKVERAVLGFAVGVHLETIGPFAGAIVMTIRNHHAQRRVLGASS